MPDTGPPWNIPYVEPTDNPRVYPAASEDLADAIALGLSAAGNPGIGSNVVQTVKTDTFTTTSTSYTTVTGLSATITPSSATSKILVVAFVNFSGGILGNGAGDRGGFIRLVGGNVSFVGDAAGSRVQAAAMDRNNQVTMSAATVVYLDSPATTSATTYTIEGRASAAPSQAFAVNRTMEDGDNANIGRAASSIAVIEVAA